MWIRLGVDEPIGKRTVESEDCAPRCTGENPNPTFLELGALSFPSTRRVSAQLPAPGQQIPVLREQKRFWLPTLCTYHYICVGARKSLAGDRKWQPQARQLTIASSWGTAHRVSPVPVGTRSTRYATLPPRGGTNDLGPTSYPLF